MFTDGAGQHNKLLTEVLRNHLLVSPLKDTLHGSISSFLDLGYDVILRLVYYILYIIYCILYIVYYILYIIIYFLALGLIANLGEGLDGTESPELVAAFVEAVHEFSTPSVSKVVPHQSIYRLPPLPPNSFSEKHF